MSVITTTPKPTRREQRRVQTVQEIKSLAMDQIQAGGPDSVSLSGIVREMSMSPAAIYRYFENRDALLADLVVDSYNQFADFIVESIADEATPTEHLAGVLNAARTWAKSYPNAYRLIFQTSSGSAQELAPERTRSASTRSMTAVVTAIAAADAEATAAAVTGSTENERPVDHLDTTIQEWGERSGLSTFSPHVLALGITAWTRLHGVISLELGGHLAAAGLDPALIYLAEVTAITRAAHRQGDGFDDLRRTN